jgi:hypothetical protein
MKVGFAPLAACLAVLAACGRTSESDSASGGSARGGSTSGQAGAGASGNDSGNGAVSAGGAGGASGGESKSGESALAGSGFAGNNPCGPANDPSRRYCSAQPEAACPTAPELDTCCTEGGLCGWEGTDGITPGPCVQSRRPGPGCLSYAAPPTHPLGELCPDAPDTACAQGSGCPSALPLTGSVCAGNARCNYCASPQARSRAVECQDGKWANLGASSCYGNVIDQ